MGLLTLPQIQKAQEATITLNKADLFALSAVSSDPYFSVQTNVKYAIVEYNSEPGNQRRVLKFDLAQAQPIAALLVSERARDSFELERVTLVDFDGGTLVINRAQLPGGLDITISSGSSGDPTLSVTSGLYSWFKGSSITGVSDGSAISSWTDESGASGSQSFVQNGSNPAPLYIASAINGKPAVRNDLVGSSLPTNSRHLVMNRHIPNVDSTIFIVAKGAAGATNSGALFSCGGGFGIGESHLAVRHRADQAGKPLWGYTSAPLAQPNLGNVGDGAFVLSIAADTDVANLATSSLKYYLNGVLAATTAGHYMKLYGDGQNYWPTQKVWLFNFYQWNFVGDIAEVIIYDRILTAEERGQVNAYLGEKYAITVA